MANTPALDIVDALAEALRRITVANGYNTDLGLNVRTERSEAGIPSAQRCTVAITNKMRETSGQNRPGNGRVLRGVIEIEVPASYDTAMAVALRAEEDVDRLLTVTYSQMPDALPVQWEEAVYLDRPEGLPVVAVEIHWSTGFRR